MSHIEDEPLWPWQKPKPRDVRTPEELAASQYGQTLEAVTRSGAFVRTDFDRLKGRGFVYGFRGYGRACLVEIFLFDLKGDLTGIDIEKRLLPANSSDTAEAERTFGNLHRAQRQPAYHMLLSREQDGTFSVARANKTSQLDQWEQEFQANVPRPTPPPHSPPVGVQPYTMLPFARTIEIRK